MSGEREERKREKKKKEELEKEQQQQKQLKEKRHSTKGIKERKTEKKKEDRRKLGVRARSVATKALFLFRAKVPVRQAALNPFGLLNLCHNHSRTALRRTTMTRKTVIQLVS